MYNVHKSKGKSNTDSERRSHDEVRSLHDRHDDVYVHVPDVHAHASLCSEL